jgi:alpha/beta superfamily hydrolase
VTASTAESIFRTRGNLVAAFNLRPDKGIGVEPDAQQAAHWLRRRVPQAQYVYCRMLADGGGTSI